MSHLSGYSTKQSSYLLCNHTISCGLCDVSYVLTLALINHLIFFIHRLLFICLAWFTLSYVSLISNHTHLVSSWWTLWGPTPSSPHMTLIKPLHVCAPFWLEIAECTVAPVAMEDSDHDVHSSSDEQDSCPASPSTHSRDHDAEQVLVTPPKTPELLSKRTVQLEDKILIRLNHLNSTCCASANSLSKQQTFYLGASRVLPQQPSLPSANV